MRGVSKPSSVPYEVCSVLLPLFRHEESNRKMKNVYLTRNLINFTPRECYSCEQEKKKRWVGHVELEKRDVYSALVGKPEGQRTLAIRTRGWENNIKIDRKEIEWDSVV